MELRFECPQCKQYISTTYDQIGCLATCSNCNSTITVPNPFAAITQTPLSPQQQPDPLPLPVVVTKPIKPSGNKTFLHGVGIGCGGLFLLCFLGFAALVIVSLNSTPTPDPSVSNSTTPEPEPRVEDIILSQLQPAFDAQKQAIFNSIHPLGTAKSITIHEVTVDSWKNNQRTNRQEDILKCTVRYTLYWEGGTTSDGFTKISATFDNESQRYLPSKILETNGLTNDDTGKIVLNAGGEILKSIFLGQ
jgi:hypothetical protein